MSAMAHESSPRSPLTFVSRRRLLAAAGGAIVTAAAAGRGRAWASVPPVEAGAFPRTVHHGLGDTTIVARPQRIVATADRDQLDVLIAMGVLPVQYGISSDYPDGPPWLDAAVLRDLHGEPMASPFEPNLELIASADPDLILDAWAEPTMHDALSDIAPTVQIKSAVTDSWESAQRLAGEACGTEEAAEAAIAATAEVIAEQADRLSEHHDLTVAVAFVLGDQLGMLTGDEIGARIVTDLGFEVVDTPDGTSANYSLEQIPDLLGGADVILSFDYGDLAAQESNELFRLLPAVAAGRYVVLPSEVASACYQESSLSLRWAAPLVADGLLVAAEGRGATLR